MSLAAVADLIAKRELSPVELTQATLERIAALEASLHAYYTVFATEALAAAQAAEAQIRRGTYLSPLHGIPIAVKDIYASGPTTGGSKLRKDYVAQQDCTAVQKLKQAGGVLLGKLATYEFALGVPTLASYFSRRAIPGTSRSIRAAPAAARGRRWPRAWRLGRWGVTRAVRSAGRRAAVVSWG